MLGRNADGDVHQLHPPPRHQQQPPGAGQGRPPLDVEEQVDHRGEAVGAQVGTAFVDALKKTGLFSEVKVYDTIPDILRDANAGRLKAGFADYPILAYNLKQGNFAEVRLVDAYKPVTVGTVAIGIRKSDTELLAKINASLAKLKSNGTIAKILEKWGQKADAS